MQGHLFGVALYIVTLQGMAEAFCGRLLEAQTFGGICTAPVGSGDDAPGVRAMQSLKETVPEAMAAASLTITLLQLYPNDAVPMLEPALRYVANPAGSLVLNL